MAILTCKCPSGLVIDVRELKGREIRKMKEVVNPMLAIVEGCTEKVVDPGPYVLEGGKLDWMKVLAGDIATALVKIAVAGFGAKRIVQFECQLQECRKANPKPTSIDLDLDKLEIREFSKEALRTFTNGNEFTATIDGATITYCLPTGAIVDAAVRRGEDAHEWQVLADVISEIELPKKGGKQDKVDEVKKFNSDKLDWIDNLNAENLKMLTDELNKHDCGPSSMIEAQCKWCYRTRSHLFPFAALAISR